MTFTFVSNYINHHQIPLCEALSRVLGEDFTFIQTMPMEEERVAMGWAVDVRKLPYVKCLYEQEYDCLKKIAESDVVLFGWTGREDIVQDRSIYEGVYVFTANNHDLGNLDDRDFETYMELFEDMTDVVRYPDLMVYLRCSVGHLASNIEKRGRSYEEQMPLRYLESLNRRYEDFITKQYQGRVLIIEADELDFLANPSDLGFITDKIDRELFGLFPDK